MKKIKGTVVYNNIGPGFWGIVDAQGNEWRPINMPEQLKTEGQAVTVSIQIIEEEMSIFMWGTAVKVTAFM